MFTGRRPSRLHLAAALGGILACSQAVAGPIDVVRDCAASASGSISGIQDLQAACPRLQEALQALGLEPVIFDGWRLNRDSLLSLANLAEDYDGSNYRSSPDVAALPGILKAMEREQTPLPQSWWDAFRAWLKAWLAHHSDTLSWLDRWLERLGQSMTPVKAITYALIAAVLAAAVAVIVNELKAGGSLRREPRRGASAVRDSSASRVPPRPEGLEPAAAADRLKELLRMLVIRLLQTRRLTTERSLTHRELVARSVFDDDAQRAVFARVAGAAESIVYGPQDAPPVHLDAVLEEGRTLLAGLPDASSAH
ncbi:MAG TPA: hypothetical protein VKG63_13065 [Steroidobacteraceae bacterium]|nr:hypothetical protein [Steroidobacteraceae bacterium]